jgi:protein gp37
MSDLFHPEVSDQFVQSVGDVMMEADWHTYQVLTKRAERLGSMLGDSLTKFARAKHIWWGVSVEDRRYGLPRIDQLRKSAASVRFLSIEPLLEDLGEIDLSGIDWVIAGGESGYKARPMQESWVKSVRDQCASAKVAFFFKQWGGPRKKSSGRILDGLEHNAFPILM